MKNITYLFGAGASYNACPIWKEQGDKMIELASSLKGWTKFDPREFDSLTQLDQIIWLIGDIGTKAKDFNTVDTYAKKLYLLKDFEGLRNLKKAVSLFFTLWSLCKDNDWKLLKDSKDSVFTRIYDIDPRYINLLATYLEEGDSNPKLKSNIKFVTWNYDLQLEAAYRKFCASNSNEFIQIDRSFPFIPDENSKKDLVVTHLNGFHGFYGKGSGENLFGRTESADLNDLLKEFQFINQSRADNVDFSNYINYAWETKSELAKTAREHAKAIFFNTNILVIVGYSFPPFNHEIDSQLFGKLKNIDKIIIQDPNANDKYLYETFGISLSKISIVNNKFDQFVIPNFDEKRTDRNNSIDFRLKKG